jgi:hypothetical protein
MGGAGLDRVSPGIDPDLSDTIACAKIQQDRTICLTGAARSRKGQRKRQNQTGEMVDEARHGDCVTEPES